MLRALTLDVERLPRPVAQPSDRDFIICGCPRSGTSLVCAALYQPPHVVTVMEPWDGMRLPAADLFSSLRREIDETGRLTRGRLDADALLGRGAVLWGTDGEFPHELRTVEGYLLGVKWPSFWRYLDLLPDTKFVVCLRDPVEVVESFRLTGGRLGEGLDYAVAFNASMNANLEAATSDRRLRRVMHYDYVNARLLPFLGHANVMAIRYERWFTESERLLAELSAFLEQDVTSTRVSIRAPAAGRDRESDEARFIRGRSSTAAALGYAS